MGKNLKLFNGLHSRSVPSNGCSFLSLKRSSKASFHIRGNGRIKSVLLSDEGDLLSRSDHAKVVLNNPPINGISGGINIQPDSIEFGTLAADITPTTIGFPLENDELDLDWPTEGFSSIPEALEDIRKGKVCFFG